ncbi:unnamed protein product [Sphagnum troendelagicum]|uniref:Homeobox domain-containing protein n=1 Tax=Sphagnum troendelagicum TaxID=128251 RepID=A0ABP0U266_9BRYO
MATTMRGFGAQNLMLMRNDSTPGSDSLVAMLASCTPMGLQGGEEALMGLDDGMDDCSPCSMSNVEKKRRLSFEQVRSLERNFELENKLEPEKKMQLAKELGLQPRQVAVWFQNRRARWKTKQLERDYEVLSQEYNRLKTEYDAVVLEKEKLESEVEVKSESMIRTDASTEVVLKTRPADSQWKQQASTSPTVEIPASILKAEKLEQQQTTSTSASNSSEILDTDSPPVAAGNCSNYQAEYVDQSCNYFLSQLDDKAGATPWWDWA